MRSFLVAPQRWIQASFNRAHPFLYDILLGGCCWRSNWLLWSWLPVGLKRILSDPFTSWSVFCCWSLAGENPGQQKHPPPPSCPRDPLRHELKVHIINARAELQDTQQKKYTVVSFFPRTMDENENRIKYAVSSCYHDHGFNEERFNFEDLEWRSESPNMLINVATKNIGQTTTKNNTELNISEMSRWVYDFLFGAWKIWKRFMHLEPLLILIYRPW